MTLIDKFYVYMYTRWVHRMMTMFGPKYALGLLLRSAEELTMKTAQVKGMHPEVLAAEVARKGDVKLWAATKGVVA